MPKILFVCLGAYKIESYKNEQNFDRQSLYSIALSQLLEIAKDEKDRNHSQIDLVVIDNTTSNPNELIHELANQFTDPHIKDVMLINNNAYRMKSKGAGEYLMCRAVIDKHSEIIESYDWIVYYTLRQIITSPIIIDTIANEFKNSSNSSIIVGNPTYLFSSGKRLPSAPGNYCDMIFAMRPKEFIGYIASMTPGELAAKNISSEQNLFNYVNFSGKNKIELDRLGVMRHDYAINKTQIV